MKMPKCYYEYFDDGSVYVADWNDNYVVAMMTNFDHILSRQACSTPCPITAGYTTGGPAASGGELYCWHG